MEIVTKSFKSYNLKADDDEGIIEAVVAVFGNVDMQNDRIKAGTFKASLAESVPRSCVNHSWDMAQGLCLEARELEPNDPLLPESIKANGGLYTKTQYFPEIEGSWDIYKRAKAGLLPEYSVGMMVTKSTKAADGANEITEGKLIEYSNCLFGVNPKTKTISTKAVEFDLSLNEQIDAVETYVDSVLGRTIERFDVRMKAGKKFSAETMTFLYDFVDTLQSKAKELKAKLDAAKSDPSATSTATPTPTTKSNANKAKVAMALADAMRSPIPIGIN